MAEGVGISLNVYEQEAYVLAKSNEFFMKLCSQTLVPFKWMASDLLRKDKSSIEVEKLQAQLNELIASLQFALDTNNPISNKNKELEPELVLVRVDLDSWW